MSRVGEFTRYIGLVVLLAALVLLAPRLTVAAWRGAVSGLRARWHRLRRWRPGTVVAEPAEVAVEVRVGEPDARDGEEVLVVERVRTRQAAREVWELSRETVQAGALVLAVTGVALRATSSLVTRLPEPLVLSGDLLLVLGTFLLMQRVIRDYPADLLPSVRAYLLHPERVRGRRPDTAPGRARHALEMALLVPGFVALVAWPVEIARFVARAQFTGPRDQVLVVWASELPWLVALAWWLARPLLPRRPARARHARPSRVAARVVPLPPQDLPGRRAA